MSDEGMQQIETEVQAPLPIVLPELPPQETLPAELLARVGEWVVIPGAGSPENDALMAQIDAAPLEAARLAAPAESLEARIAKLEALLVQKASK